MKDELKHMDPSVCAWIRFDLYDHQHTCDIIIKESLLVYLFPVVDMHGWNSMEKIEKYPKQLEIRWA